MAGWICECANTDCAELIAITPGEYADVRAGSVRFVVAPGDPHVFLDAEDVVLRTDRFWVVEKFGAAAEAAAADGNLA